MPHAEPGVQRWLLLIHSIPPKPDYFRVKVGRRLQRIGAVAIKNSVYALPSTDETYEDFEWVLREIVEGGGEASMCEASFVEGLSNSALVEIFREARDADYREMLAEAERILRPLRSANTIDAARRAEAAAELNRLHRRVDELAGITFFPVDTRARVQHAIEQIEATLRETGRTAHSVADETGTLEAVRGRVWVTRRDIHVDRMASAWLIRRFIDPEARFKFVAAKGYTPVQGELRFDMYEAEYTHEGDRCTFETLLDRFGLDDPALHVLGEIVHDIDFKEHRFERPEASGIERLIAGIALAHEEDATRVERASTALVDLYAAFAALSEK